MDSHEHILWAMREMERLGHNRGASGNCSLRLADAQDQMLITPSGVPAQQLQADMLVAMQLHGSDTIASLGTALGRHQSTPKPSSEWRFHRDIYLQWPEIHAVVHAHSPFATTMACLGQDIPAFHYMIAVAGGDSIRCTPYALFGSQALSNYAIAALQDRKACLLGQHGMIAMGKTMADAMRIAIEVESLCEIYWRALQIRSPMLLNDQEMQQVIEKFKTYGPTT